MKQLNPQDATFLYMESDYNYNHVTSVQIYDPSTRLQGGVATLKDLIGHVSSRLHHCKFLTQRLSHLPFELDFPYWVDDDYFDIEFHIQDGRLPAGSDWSTFCNYVARYHSRPLSPNRPLWDMCMLVGLDSIDGMPKGCFAILTKIHHAAVDGAAMVKFFSIMHDLDCRGTSILLDEVDDCGEPDILPNNAVLIKRAFLSNLKSPVRIVDTVMRVVPGVYRSVRDKYSQNENRHNKNIVPDTRFNSSVSPHKNFDATTFSLEDLRTIRKVISGVTVNDVVLAICSGALRTYLQFHEELPKESLIAWVPINTRIDGETDAQGNNISAMTTPIFTSIEDPITRLRYINDATRKSKAAKSGVSAKIMTDLSKHIPAATQLIASKLLIKNSTKMRVCNLFISNVPGPQKPYYMQGSKVISTYGLTPISDGMGLFINTPSYNGNIIFNVVTTREIIPDIRFFVECLEGSFEKLKLAANTIEIDRAMSKYEL